MSGTVHLNEWDCPPYNWDCPPYKWDSSTYKWDRKWHDILPVPVEGEHTRRVRIYSQVQEEEGAGRDLLQLCAALIGTDSRQKRTYALDLFRKQTNRTAAALP